ncbi:hypothetical protein ACVT1Y_16665, partial [Klebsiella pneumoniae]
GSCAAPSAKGDDKFITTDYLQQCPRIYEAFPLLCPMCGGQMRIIAFITHSAEIRHILNHIGVESAPPHITPARGPPLWEGCDAPVDDGAQGEPDWDLAAQPDEVDQRVNW